MMEDIRLTCQEYPQHRMGGTRIGAGDPQKAMGGTRAAHRWHAWIGNGGPSKWHVDLGADGWHANRSWPARTGWVARRSKLEEGYAQIGADRLGACPETTRAKDQLAVVERGAEARTLPPAREFPLPNPSSLSDAAGWQEDQS